MDGRVIELYGTSRLVPEVEVVSKEEMEGPTRPVQPDIVVMMWLGFMGIGSGGTQEGLVLRTR